MAKKKVIKKRRAKEYEKKLSIDGTLDEVLRVSVPRPKEKKKNGK